jgi:transposase-like protein
MVAAVRAGVSRRQVARQFGVPLATVQYWARRAGDVRLDRVDWSNRLPGARTPANKTAPALEDLVLTVRQELRETSALGEYGAEAVHRTLRERGVPDLPGVRTVGRILERRGVLDARRRVRRPAPAPGWYLPPVADRRAELDSFDIVEGLVIRGGHGVEVPNGISLHGGLVASWPRARITAKTAVDALVGHWRQFGLPAYAQFDNDTVFQGPHHYTDVVGRVMRACLGLGVTPVFVPARETGFQAGIESYNGRWQAKVWQRFTHASRKALQGQSAKYVTACRRKAAARIEAAPERQPFPRDWRLDLQAPPKGCIIFLRRTSDTGVVTILGHTFVVDVRWPHRLVRAEVDLDGQRIRFYALRRRAPQYQPLLRDVAYALPHRTFQE